MFILPEAVSSVNVLDANQGWHLLVRGSGWAPPVLLDYGGEVDGDAGGEGLRHRHSHVLVGPQGVDRVDLLVTHIQLDQPRVGVGLQVLQLHKQADLASRQQLAE